MIGNTGDMANKYLDALREVTERLPQVTERISHGAPCFYVGDRPLCYFHDHHGGDDRVTIWCPTPEGAAAELAEADPARFFRPTPLSSGTFRDWLGIIIDPPPTGGVDWLEVAAAITEAFRLIAPQRLAAELDMR